VRLYPENIAAKSVTYPHNTVKNFDLLELYLRLISEEPIYALLHGDADIKFTAKTANRLPLTRLDFKGRR
tara:strand:- start:285 stop:494 length:210 start_codon:yes stop_codon:yes gene_type:complete